MFQRALHHGAQSIKGNIASQTRFWKKKNESPEGSQFVDERIPWGIAARIEVNAPHTRETRDFISSIKIVKKLLRFNSLRWGFFIFKNYY